MARPEAARVRKTPRPAQAKKRDMAEELMAGQETSQHCGGGKGKKRRRAGTHSLEALR